MARVVGPFAAYQIALSTTLRVCNKGALLIRRMFGGAYISRDYKRATFALTRAPVFAQDATDPSVLTAAKAPKAVAVSECTAKSFSLTMLLSPPEHAHDSGIPLSRIPVWALVLPLQLELNI